MKLFIKSLNEYKTIIDMSIDKWFEALELGNLNLIKAYLANGFDINTLNKYHGTTALMYAVVRDSEEIVKELLSHPDLNINIQDNYGESALIKSTKYGSTDEILKILLNHPNIDLTLKNLVDHTALYYAKDFNNQKIIDLLKEVGAE